MWRPLTIVAEEILNRVGLVNEMSYSLKEYRDGAEALRIQIVENWCLCKYCHIFDTENLNRQHWMTELLSYIERLKRARITKGMDKRKSLERVWVKMCDLNDREMVFDIIKNKFKREHFTDISKITTIANEFADGGIHRLIDCISNKEIEVDEYMDSEFCQAPLKTQGS